MIRELHPHFNHLHFIKHGKPADVPEGPGPSSHASQTIELRVGTGAAEEKPVASRSTTLPESSEASLSDPELKRCAAEAVSLFNVRELCVENPRNLYGTESEVHNYRLCENIPENLRADLIAFTDKYPSIDR